MATFLTLTGIKQIPLSDDQKRVMRAKISEKWEQLKRKKRPLFASTLTLALFAVFQNCGVKTASQGNSLNANSLNQVEDEGATRSTVPVLSPDANSFTFRTALNDPARTFVITNDSSSQAMNVKVSSTFSSRAFAVTSSTCDGTILSSNSRCSIAVSYRNCSRTQQSGFLKVDYQDQSGIPQASLVIPVSGPAGNPLSAACLSANISSSSSDQVTRNNQQVDAVTDTRTMVRIFQMSRGPDAGSVFRNVISLSSQEQGLLNLGYRQDYRQLQFQVYAVQYDSGMVPIVRCQSNSSMVFRSGKVEDCRNRPGFQIELLGWMLSQQRDGAVPLYRAYDTEAVSDQFSLNAGDGFPDIVGYVFR